MCLFFDIFFIVKFGLIGDSQFSVLKGKCGNFQKNMNIIYSMRTWKNSSITIICVNIPEKERPGVYHVLLFKDISSPRRFKGYQNKNAKISVASIWQFSIFIIITVVMEVILQSCIHLTYYYTSIKNALRNYNIYDSRNISK